jgi:lysozyme family protein
VKQTYHDAIQGVFAHEGGYTNHPADPGGPTNWGITIYDARKYWKPDANASDVKDMPKEVAERIYQAHYAAPLCYDDLPAGVDYTVLDYGINSGIWRSAKALQRCCGAVPDGIIGPEMRSDRPY